MSPITRDLSTETGTDVDGRSTRWEDHREARRAELVRAARRVVHYTGPDASMGDIATAAGTSKSIVYRYFTDKDGLQLAVAAAVVADIRDALDVAATGAATPREALRGMVDTYLAMIESSPHVYTFVTRGGSVGAFLDSVTELVADPFVRALGLDESDPDAGWARLWAAGAVGFVRGAGERWLAGDEAPGADREDVAARVAAWLWAGPVAVLSRERTGTRGSTSTPTTPSSTTTSSTSAPPAPPARPAQSRVDDDAPSPGESA